MAILDRVRHFYDFEPDDFEGFVISDLMQGDDLKVLLMVESPHRDELLKGFPLVGATGRSVTKLLDALVHQMCPVRPPVPAQPIGRLCGRRDTGFGWLGLMNACQIPLQKKAYDCNPELWNKYANLLTDLQNFKDDLDKDPGADITGSGLGQSIAADLAERLAPVQHRGLLLIPCGRIARALCAEVNFDVDCRLPRVPHPGAPDPWGHAPALVEMAEVIRGVLLD